MLGERIKQARRDAGLSQIQLADRLRATGDPRFAGADYKRIGAWENGAPRLAFYAVEAIARQTGKPLEFFAEGPTPRAEPGRAPDPALEAEIEELEQRAREVVGRLRQRREEGS